jgi:hypothetical protein
MTTATQHLLDAFDRLSAEEQQAVACELLRRLRDVDLPPLSDEELVLSAEALFLNSTAEKPPMPEPQRGDV